MKLHKVYDVMNFSISVCFFLISYVLSYELEGSGTSYAKYPPWRPCQNGSIELEFKTAYPNGLMLYTDDSGYTDYFELKLLAGTMHLVFNLGGDKMRLAVGQNLNDSFWHTVSIIRSGRNMTLKVDNIPFSREYHSGDQIFGVGKNSPVFIGGIPPEYKEKITALTKPQIFYEAHFRGSVRNVLFSDCGARKMRPDMNDYRGIVDRNDLCMTNNPCLHGGICLTRDSHVECDCSQTDFEGKHCGKESFKYEVTFFGSDYFFYDLTNGDPISSSKDRVELYFRTRQSSGFLFYTGEKSDFLSIALMNGWIVALVNLGTGEVNLDISPQNYRFDDNQWHHLVLERNSREVQLTVDGIHQANGQTVGNYKLLDSRVLYVGGHPFASKMGQGIIVTNNFKGCMKQVVYTADSLKLDLTQMASTSHSWIQVHGKVAFNKCHDMVESNPVTFTTPESFIPLPRWKVGRLGGTLSFKFQTNEPNGVIMYNSRQSNTDFFAFELLDGYLWYIVDLGSGPLKERVANYKVNDAKVHEVTLEHLSNSGYIMLDGKRKDYIVQGESTNLNLDGELYVGGIGNSKSKLPKDMWAGMLGNGYVGCLQDLVLNGNNVDLLTVALKNLKGGIADYCRVMEPKCLTRPCLHGGICNEGWNRYKCDCRSTGYTGAQCQTTAATLEFDGAQYMKITLPEESYTEAEDISLRFRTRRNNGLLLMTSSDRSNDQMELYLELGIIKLDIIISNRKESLAIGRNPLSDQNWHTIHIKRRGEQILLGLDGHSPVAAVIALGYNRAMGIKQYVLGSPAPMLLDEMPEGSKGIAFKELSAGNMARDENRLRIHNGFIGSMQQLVFNGNEFFELAKSKKIQNIELTARFDTDEPILRDTVTFKSSEAYVELSQLEARLQFSIYFKFKTTEPDGLILFNGGQGQDFIALELQSGYLHFVYNVGDGAKRIVVNTIDPLNDNEWHDVSLQRPGMEQIQVRVDNINPTIGDLTNSKNFMLDLKGPLYIGGVSKNMYNSLPTRVSSRHGYQGCLASVDFNGERPNLYKQAKKIYYAVLEGCHGPSNSCRSDSCYNGGRCLQQWNSYICDCEMTSYTGMTCNQESTSAVFGKAGGLITYHFPSNKRPSTQRDNLALGFRTTQNYSGVVVLFRVESSFSTDNIEVQLSDGTVFVVYNVGTPFDLPLTDMFHKINDGKYHVIRVKRKGANMTFVVDNNRPVHKIPSKNDQKWIVFNDQARIFVGGNNKSGPGMKPFHGTLTGVVFNGVPVLDLAARNDPFITIHGDVRIRRRSEMQSTEGIRFMSKHKREVRRSGEPKYENDKSSAQSNYVVRTLPVVVRKQTGIRGNRAHQGKDMMKTDENDMGTQEYGSAMFPIYDDEDGNDDDVDGSGSGLGTNDINMIDGPSDAIDAKSTTWKEKFEHDVVLDIKKFEHVEDSIHHHINVGSVVDASQDWSHWNLVKRPSAGKFPKDRGKIDKVVLGEETRQQIIEHSRNKAHTTPRQGVTDNLIVTDGSGNGCPPENCDPGNPDAESGIIVVDVKTTIRTRESSTKSQIISPCEDEDNPKCAIGTDFTFLNQSDPSKTTTNKGTIPVEISSTTLDKPVKANQEVTKTNFALIIGIVAGVVIALIILVVALYKFRSRDEGTYKVDESQNFAYLEGKKHQGNGALLGNNSSTGKSGKKKDVKEWYV